MLMVLSVLMLSGDLVYTLSLKILSDNESLASLTTSKLLQH